MMVNSDSLKTFLSILKDNIKHHESIPNTSDMGALFEAGFIKGMLQAELIANQILETIAKGD